MESLSDVQNLFGQKYVPRKKRATNQDAWSRFMKVQNWWIRVETPHFVCVYVCVGEREGMQQNEMMKTNDDDAERERGGKRWEKEVVNICAGNALASTLTPA